MACTHQIHEARLEMGLKTSGADALEPKKAKCHGVSSASQPRGPKVEGHVVRDERRLLTRHELHEAADGTFPQRRLLGQRKQQPFHPIPCLQKVLNMNIIFIYIYDI